MDNNYKHILLAVDLHLEPKQNEGKKITFVRALEVAHEYKAKLTIIHAIEHINAYGVAQAYPAVVDLEKQLVEEAKQELDKLCQTHGIQDAITIIDIGSPKMVILEQAKKLGVDLIVVGSHGRHGLNLLLGSTANAILHHAPCDVLTVRKSKDVT